MSRCNVVELRECLRVGRTYLPDVGDRCRSEQVVRDLRDVVVPLIRVAYRGVALLRGGLGRSQIPVQCHRECDDRCLTCRGREVRSNLRVGDG